MNNQDFDYLVITTQNSWHQGLSKPGWVDKQGRLSLAPRETIPLPKKVIQHPLGLPLDCRGDPYRGVFISDRSRELEIGKLIAIAFDRKNNLFLVDGETCRLYKYNPQGESLEQVMYIGKCGSQPGRFNFSRASLFYILAIFKGSETLGISLLWVMTLQTWDALHFSPPDDNSPNDKEYCGRIAFGKSTLYVSDSFNHRVQALYLPSFQIRFILGEGNDPGQQAFKKDPVKLGQPKDIFINHHGDLYVLDVDNKQILIFNKYGMSIKVIDSNDIDADSWNPVTMALEPEGDRACEGERYLYVFDSEQCTIVKFDRNGNWQKNWCCEIRKLLETVPQLQITTMTVDLDKIIYLGDINHCSVTRIHQFDGGGRYLGYIEREGECRQLTIDRQGTLYGLFNPNSQIVSFASQKHFAGQGTYFSKVLDSTIDKCQWHRLMLEAEIPAKTGLEVDFYTSDNPIELASIDPEAWQLVLSSPQNSLETKDALFDEAQGRYLILRFKLSGDGNSSPQIETVRIYFERQSYLRYLPATYQENSRGRDFLERFLSIFESMSLEMEEKIAGINQYWDVMAVEPEFLDWLASWLAIINDDQWSEKKRRELLKQAFPLFKLRGTKKGLHRIIKIFTGKNVGIVEHFRLRPPLVLGQASLVGITTFVGPKPTQRLILGEESARIGEFLLTDEEDSPEKPFEYDAYDFTVLADTSQLKDEEAKEQALRRLIEQDKPAHTRYFLRTTVNGAAQLGKHGFLEVDTVLTSGYKPMRLGKNSKIGITTLLGTKYPLKGTVGIRSKISVDAILH